DLPKTSNVALTVFNIAGQAVETLVNEQRPAGTHTFTFDGSRLASGAYFYTLNAGGYAETKKMLLVK
ncbi:T9SS C-terminal target domain-containing protein, partial [bacterium]